MEKLVYESTLYSRAANNKLLQWTIRIYQTNKSPRYGKMLILSGYVNGNLKEYSHTYLEGKNIGKSNETDGLGQALEEAKSRKASQINKGYRELSLEEAEEELGATKLDRNNKAKPMLAKLYKSGICDFPRIIQFKYNGVRAELGFKEQDDGLFGTSYVPYLLSRDGHEYVIPKDMKSYLEQLVYTYHELKDYKFDGEVYCHGMLLQDINSAIKKENENSSKLYFVSYDLKNDNIQVNRLKELEKLYHKYFKDSKYFKFAPSVTVYSEEAAYKMADSFIEDGYEGAILRDPNGKYVSTRTKSLLKIKKVYSKQFLITDIIPTERDNFEGLPIGLFICKNEITGNTFKVTPKASKKDRYDILLNKNKYIGTYLEVEYREISRDKVPIHAVGIINNLK